MLSKCIKSRYARPAYGFTLVELLIVVAVMALILAMLIPIASRVLTAGRVEQGLNMISSTSTTAQAFSLGRNRAFKEIVIEPPSDQARQREYAGVAMLFTPGNQIRMVENIANQPKWNGSEWEKSKLRHAGPTAGANDGELYTSVSQYGDIAGWDYMNLGQRVGVVGIGYRTVGGTEQLVLLPPPFAVRFDPNGALVMATDPGEPRDIEEMVFYDGNYDGVIHLNDGGNDGKYGSSERGVDRDNSWNPTNGAVSGDYSADRWDPNSPFYEGEGDLSFESEGECQPGYMSVANPTSNDQITRARHDGKLKLPFEKIECVAGVVVFNMTDFRGAGYSFMHDASGVDGPDNGVFSDLSEGTAGGWIMNNGRMLFFNWHSGLGLAE